MLSNIETIVRPSTVEEAVRAMGDGGGALIPIAGGTATNLFRSTRVKGVIDLWSLPTRFIEHEGRTLRLGATSTIGDLLSDERCRRYATGALADAAAGIGSTLLRNLITVGGNLAGLFPWSDLPPLLLALDAGVILNDGEEARLSIDELLTGRPANVLGNGRLLTEIILPELTAGTGAAFIKFADSKVAYSWLNVAALLEVEDGICRRCRLAIGAVEPFPRRLANVEDLLLGEKLSADLAARAGLMAARNVKPGHDPRSSADYRAELTGVLVKRALIKAWERASLMTGGE